MKKTLTIMIIALVVITTAFAFDLKSVSIEAGQGIMVSLDMDIAENFDTYARLGYSEFNMFNISAGAQYKVAEFDVGRTPVAFQPGLQIDFNLGNGFIFCAFATLGFSFDTGSLTAFLRPEFGLAAAKNYGAFAWGVEAGVGYLIK